MEEKFFSRDKFNNSYVDTYIIKLVELKNKCKKLRLQDFLLWMSLNMGYYNYILSQISPYRVTF